MGNDTYPLYGVGPDEGDDQSQAGVINSDVLLDDLNFMKNQLQCAIINMKDIKNLAMQPALLEVNTGSPGSVKSKAHRL